MLKYCIAICFLVASSLSCSKENKEQENPEAVKALIAGNENCVCDPYIDQYLWMGKTIYYLGYKGPNCDWFPTFYDDKGERINMEWDYIVNHFAADSKLIKRIWTCGE